jgi:hypothetical protein
MVLVSDDHRRLNSSSSNDAQTRKRKNGGGGRKERGRNDDFRFSSGVYPLEDGSYVLYVSLCYQFLFSKIT